MALSKQSRAFALRTSSSNRSDTRLLATLRWQHRREARPARKRPPSGIWHARILDFDNSKGSGVFSIKDSRPLRIPRPLSLVCHHESKSLGDHFGSFEFVPICEGVGPCQQFSFNADGDDLGSLPDPRPAALLPRSVEPRYNLRVVGRI